MLEIETRRDQCLAKKKEIASPLIPLYKIDIQSRSLLSTYYLN